MGKNYNLDDDEIIGAAPVAETEGADPQPQQKKEPEFIKPFLVKNFPKELSDAISRTGEARTAFIRRAARALAIQEGLING